MNSKKYSWILYLISITILVTISVQLYWNYKNFQESKRQISSEIQISLDNAIEEYYSNISKRNFFTIINSGGLSIKSSKGFSAKDTLIEQFWSLEEECCNDSIQLRFSATSLKTQSFRNSLDGIPKLLDSILKKDTLKSISVHNHKRINKNSRLPYITLNANHTDSTRVMKGLQSVYIALTNDSINFNELDSLLNNQFIEKELTTDFYFQYTENGEITKTTREKTTQDFNYKADSKSTYLRPNQKLTVYYSDPQMEALKKSSTGIILSLLLSLTIVGSLFYLLRIINRQKELAEIKNDLISNITHEFKTPIATVATAIEAIENFNVLDDKEKTQRYLSMSSLQLKKLHQMVEKLLETATLDSEKLILQKEETDLIDLVERVTKKHSLLTEKKLMFSKNMNQILAVIDAFHFENAVTNLVDNAIKYGGDDIQVNVNLVMNTIEISVADDGKGIEKNQQDKIFDKFYRVPKGNRHDIKGFGIGLYYTKKIIHKHGGTIHLTSDQHQTIFKVILSYGS